MDPGFPVGEMSGAARAVAPSEPRQRTAAGSGLFRAFHEAGVRYCFWKSDPEELERSLHGASDLDVLIDRAHSRGAQDALARSGFKRFSAVPAKAYPAVEDYLALDPAAGAILHCHAHYRLLIGRANRKEYRLPWEDLLLDTRQFDARAGVYVADPDVEILLLLLRFAAKLGLRDFVRPLLGHSRFGVEFRTQLERLRPCVNPVRSRELCAELLGERVAAHLPELLESPVAPAFPAALAWLARDALRAFRRHGRFTGLVYGWWRTIAWVAGGAGRRYLRLPLPLRRTVPAGGVLVAVMGPDGAGKSTVTRELATAFAAKLDVFRVYFGSGDGPSSLLRWPMLVARRALKRSALVGRAARRGDRPEGTLLSWARVVWALTLSLEKRRKLRATWHARNRGMIVVADRYPQVQFTGFNDGPLLGHLAKHSWGVLRRMARWEAAPYVWAERHAPDLIVKLNVAPKTALRRKPELSLAEVERRIRAVRCLTYAPPTAVVDIDADRPLAEVRRAVWEAVWNQL